MKFNEAVVRNFLSRRNLPACEVCGNNDWGYTLDVMELRPFSAGAPHAGGGGIMPLLAVFCNNCNNLKAFTAIGAGLVDSKGNVLGPDDRVVGNTPNG